MKSHNIQKKCQSKRRFPNSIKLILLAIAIILGVSFLFYLLPENIRRTAGSTIMTTFVITVITTYIIPLFLKKEKISVTILVILISSSVPSLAAIINPQLDISDIISNKEKDIVIDDKHDKDLLNTVEESVAIETVANDFDENVFKKFYDISYVENGKVKTKPNASESMKIQLIMDSIIHEIETSSLHKSDYTESELNSGKYSELTSQANIAENELKQNKDRLNKQQKISIINSYLEQRINAYKIMQTSDLAKLIGHTYTELSQYQTVNDNIYSNCSSISYYLKYCCLSKPEFKSKMFYEIGVRYNKIAEIAHSIYQQENSAEYRKLYIDSLYMAISYYKLYRNSFIDDYKNNFYLARSYKSLSVNTESVYNQIEYLENSLDIFFILKNNDENVNSDSKISLYKTLYNTLIEYESTPNEYRNKYTDNYIIEQKNLVNKLINQHNSSE